MNIDEAITSAIEELGADPQPGKLARAIRTRLGLSLKDVAERVGNGTHFTTIAKLEKGVMQMTFVWAREIARALNVPADLFSLAFEFLNSPRKVPAYSSIFSLADRARQPIDFYEATMSSRPGLLALRFYGPPDILSDIVLYTGIIDPAKRSLEDGKLYVIMPASKFQYRGVAIYRNRKPAPYFVPWFVAPTPDISADEEGLEVVGLVIELQRQLVSRSS